MDLPSATRVYEALYSKVNAFDLWQRNRFLYKEHLESLGYGEVNPESVQLFISRADPKPGEVFYDLGAGTGKAVFLAGMLFDFSKSAGIELIDALVRASKQCLRHYDETFRPELPEAQQRQEIAFLEGSFLEVDFSDADIIFTHSTLFTTELWDKLTERLEGTKPGTRIVCMTKSLPESSFELKDGFNSPMPWGRPGTQVYVRR